MPSRRPTKPAAIRPTAQPTEQITPSPAPVVATKRAAVSPKFETSPSVDHSSTEGKKGDVGADMAEAVKKWTRETKQFEGHFEQQKSHHEQQRINGAAQEKREYAASVASKVRKLAEADRQADIGRNRREDAPSRGR